MRWDKMRIVEIGDEWCWDEWWGGWGLSSGSKWDTVCDWIRDILLKYAIWDIPDDIFKMRWDETKWEWNKQQIRDANWDEMMLD